MASLQTSYHILQFTQDIKLQKKKKPQSYSSQIFICECFVLPHPVYKTLAAIHSMLTA